MRYKEIITELSIPDTMEDANQRLRSAGYKVIGSGTFAEIYEKPGISGVLKLFKNSDHAFEAFVNMTRKHNNKHFPKYGTKIINVTPNYKAIRMERLLPLGDDDIVPATILWDYFDDPKGSDWREDVIAMLKKDPDIKYAVTEIRQLITPTSIPDLSFSNIMKRSDGTLVFTDPLYSKKSY